MTNEAPEDLSVKHRSVAVQTDKKEQDKFLELFDVFTEKQLRTMINILVNLVNQRRESKKNLDIQEEVNMSQIPI